MAGGCALPTALHAIERADVRLGDYVLVLGSGPVGIASTILALMRGAFRVLCIGAPSDRLECAIIAGAYKTLNFEEHSPADQISWVQQHTAGRGVDVSIEATGAPEAVLQAMRCTRDAGRVVVVGQYTDHGAVSFNPHHDLNKKHLEVRGVWGSDFSHFFRGVQIICDAQRADLWGAMKTRTYDLSQANEALADVAAGDVLKALIRPHF